jgi:hypothetical protein
LVSVFWVDLGGDPPGTGASASLTMAGSRDEAAEVCALFVATLAPQDELADYVTVFYFWPPGRREKVECDSG